MAYSPTGNNERNEASSGSPRSANSTRRPRTPNRSDTTQATTGSSTRHLSETEQSSYLATPAEGAHEIVHAGAFMFEASRVYDSPPPDDDNSVRQHEADDQSTSVTGNARSSETDASFARRNEGVAANHHNATGHEDAIDDGSTTPHAHLVQQSMQNLSSRQNGERTHTSARPSSQNGSENRP